MSFQMMKIGIQENEKQMTKSLSTICSLVVAKERSEGSSWRSHSLPSLHQRNKHQRSQRNCKEIDQTLTADDCNALSSRATFAFVGCKDGHAWMLVRRVCCFVVEWLQRVSQMRWN